MGVDVFSESHRMVTPSRSQDVPPLPVTWDRDNLLELSNLVRSDLANNKPPDTSQDRLSNFLEKAIKDGASAQPTLNLNTIEYAHLDKLVEDIAQDSETFGSKPSMQYGKRHLATGPQLRSRVNASNAKRLRHAWRRFSHVRYLALDQKRTDALHDGAGVNSPSGRGDLADISFDSTKEIDGPGQWTSLANRVMYNLQGSFPFEPGHWWLNITCAERDGIVSSSLERPSVGRYGITVTPLLTGFEELLRTGTFKYVRKGNCSDMHVSLISQVGREIHIIRGYQLKSILAPEAGVRYDGLFILKQYGHKLDSATGIYQLELTLERSPGQISLEEIRQTPRPSQLDNWALYQKFQGNGIREGKGESVYLAWKLKKQEEKVVREDWKKSRMLRASLMGIEFC